MKPSVIVDALGWAGGEARQEPVSRHGEGGAMQETLMILLAIFSFILMSLAFLMRDK